MAAGESAWEFSRWFLEVVFEADGTGLVFDVVGLEQLGGFEESLEVDGHGWGGRLFGMIFLVKRAVMTASF